MTPKNIIPKESTADREIVISRVFDAPRELVFQAWINPKHLEQWWGPAGFTNPVCKADARPGGAILIHMHSPEGTVYPMTGEYREIVEPERLVFTSGALDGEGRLMFEVMNTVTFTEQAGKTTLTLRARPFNVTPAAAPHLSGMKEGWTQSLERLGAFVTKV